jgi:dTDP-4-dehydrorhamnose 3,5-epimerase
MNIITTPLSGLLVIEPKIFGDQRGYFFESFHAKRYQEAGLNCNFVQDNMSRSQKGVLRGLHFQMEQAQDKLVTVSQGAVFDVAVDIRIGSPTFGQWYGTILDDQNHKQMFVPKGFAHGFCVLSDSADFHYKCSDYYAPEYEMGVIWNDPDIGIEWPFTGAPILSAKDQAYKHLKDLDQSSLPKFRA